MKIELPNKKFKYLWHYFVIFMDKGKFNIMFGKFWNCNTNFLYVWMIIPDPLVFKYIQIAYLK